MARLKRLTRRQKVLLSAIKAGGGLPRTTDPADLDALEAHDLIRLGADGWEATDQEGAP